MFNIKELIKIDWIASIITGIVSGIIASICFYQILKHVKPKIKISAKICIDDSVPDKPIHYIKFINKSRKVITRLDYVLQYVVIGKDNVHAIREIEPCKPKLKTIDKYSRKDNDAKYAVRISFEIPEDEYPMNDDVQLLFTVLAEDPSSGTTSCLTQVFTAKDIVVGTHETKTSLAYIERKTVVVPTSAVAAS